MAFNPTLSRRQLLAAIGLTGAGLTLAACAGTGGAGGTGGGAEGDPNKIVFWSNHPANSKDVELELIKRFEAENPELTVELVDAGANYQEVAQKFNAALTGTDLPDVVVLSDTEWFNFALNEATVNVDEVADRAGVELSTYVASLYNDYQMNGGHYGLPFARSTVLFYYNKDKWAEAGLPERGPETWEEMSEWGPKLQEVMGGSKAMGWADATSYLSWTFHGPMRTLGGSYSEDWEPALTSPETVEAVNWFKSTIDEGWATISSDVTNEFSTGLIGSCIQSTGDLSSVMESANFNVGVAELPNPQGQGGAVTGGAGLGIPSGISEQRQENALKFIDFITSVENTTYWSRETGYVPVRQDADQDPEHAKFLAENPEFGVALGQLPKTLPQDNFRVLLPNGDRIIGDQLEAIALTGADVRESLGNAENQLVTIYERDIEPLL